MSRSRQKEETVALDATTIPSMNLPEAFSYFFTLSSLFDKSEGRDARYSMSWKEQEEDLNAMEVRQWIFDALLYFLKNYYGLLGQSDLPPGLPTHLSDHPHLKVIESTCLAPVISCQVQDAPLIFPSREEGMAIITVLERQQKEESWLDEFGREQNQAPSPIDSARSSLPEIDLSSLSDDEPHSSFMGGFSLFSCWSCVGRRASQEENPTAQALIKVSFNGLGRQLDNYLKRSCMKWGGNLFRNSGLLNQKQQIAREILSLINPYVTAMSVTNGESADAIFSKINQSCAAIEELNISHKAGHGRLLPILETFYLENFQDCLGRQTENSYDYEQVVI